MCVHVCVHVCVCVRVWLHGICGSPGTVLFVLLHSDTKPDETLDGFDAENIPDTAAEKKKTKKKKKKKKNEASAAYVALQTRPWCSSRRQAGMRRPALRARVAVVYLGRCVNVTRSTTLSPARDTQLHSHMAATT